MIWQGMEGCWGNEEEEMGGLHGRGEMERDRKTERRDDGGGLIVVEG